MTDRDAYVVEAQEEASYSDLIGRIQGEDWCDMWAAAGEAIAAHTSLTIEQASRLTSLIYDLAGDKPQIVYSHAIIDIIDILGG